MAVLLRRSTMPAAGGWDAWIAISRTGPDLDPARRLANLAPQLESAFDAAMPDWLALGRSLAGQPTARLAHTPTSASNISDFGVMLAWSRLVAGWATEARCILVLCDDPWLFRHLAGMPGVEAGAPPPLQGTEIRLALRGLLARLRVSWRMARAALALKNGGGGIGQSWILVYGHPASTENGDDAYFGTLMRELPGLRRLLHVDCGIDLARRLGQDGRTVSLHGFGSPWAALGLWRKRWHPRAEGSHSWLVRRAAALEGGTGTPAMIAWQIHCQERFLERTKPRLVAWPWEHHSWERVFVAACRARKVVSLGYQHAAVGWREWNQGPGSDPAGSAGLPDRILCLGEAHRRRLAGYGVPEDRMAIGGALRYTAAQMPRHDKRAPVFVALPFDPGLAREMVEAVRPLAGSGRTFLVKDHPMTPYPVPNEPGLSQTATGLSGQEAVSAVIYCATTVGLEAALAGLPTLRFLPAARPVLDVLPDGLAVPAAGADGLATALDRLQPGPPLDRSMIFATPDHTLWKALLTP